MYPVWLYVLSKAGPTFAALTPSNCTTWPHMLPASLFQGQLGNGVMDLYTPEISCQCGDNTTGIPSTAINNGSGVDLAKNVPAARAYDELHVQAIINQINGRHSSGDYAMEMPNLFGLNFQAVSVGQKVSTPFVKANSSRQ